MANRVSTAAPPDVQAAVRREKSKLDETDFVLSFVEKSHAFRQPFLEVWREVLDNYMVSPLGDNRQAVPRIGSTQFTTARTLRNEFRAGRSVLKDPETNQIIDTLAAQGVGLLMPQLDYIKAMPIGFDDQEKARFLGRLLQGILQAPGNFRTNFTTFKDSFIFGTAILHIGWETRSRLQVVKKPVFDEETGFLVGFDSDVGEVVHRDGPLIRQIDVFDFYPDPSGTRIQENMLGIAFKFRISTQEAIRLAEAGVYDMADVLEAIRNAGGEHEQDQAFSEDRFPTMDRSTHDDYGMLHGFEFWGEVPFRPADGARNRVITVLNGVRVRSHINPYLDGNIPFKEIVLNPVQGRFYGLGVGEIIRFLQDSTDSLLMTYTDASELAARNPILMGATFNGDPSRLARRLPNDVIPCGNQDAVKPLPIDTSALQFAVNEYQRRKFSMREASGATNPMQAIPTSDRQTATEVTELVRLATQKVELMVQLVERDDYPWIGKTIHSRLRQFLSQERQQVLAGEAFPVTLDDVDFEADIRFVGARQAQSKFQKAATLREAINVLGTNPGIITIMRGLVTRYLRDGLDIQDAEEIVNEAVQAIQQQQAAAMQAQQAQAAAEAETGNTAQNANENTNTFGEEVRNEGRAVA